MPVSQLGPRASKPAWMVCVRADFPYELKHPSTPIPGDARPIMLHPTALAPGDPDPAQGWETLDADVDDGTARALATLSFQKHSLEPSVVFNDAEIVVLAIHFVRYPIWFARYRYDAEVAPTRDGLFHVGISAADGTPVTALHPSKLRAGAARLKKLFGWNG